MSTQQCVKLYNGITNIKDYIIEEAQTAGVRRNPPIWVRWTAAAACICVILAGVLVWRQPADPIPSADSGITVSEDGVTIPPMKVSLSANEAADMIAFFIYQGRCYVSYEWIYGKADLAGEYLGTATGMIDEWTTQDGYVDFAGSVRGDFYSVKGFNPSFMLCMKYEDGSVHTYICDNGITLKTGCDLYEERMHLSENYDAVTYETRASWYHDEGMVYQLNDPENEVISDFVEALNEAAFLPQTEIPLDDGETNVYTTELWHMFFHMENGMSVHLRLLEGGYVIFRGISQVCVQIPEEQFNNVIALLSDPAAGTAGCT